MSTATEQFGSEAIYDELREFVQHAVGAARQAGIVSTFQVLVPESIIWAAGFDPQEPNCIEAHGELVPLTPYPHPHGTGPYGAALAYRPEL